MAKMDDIAAAHIAPLTTTISSAKTQVVVDAFRLVIPPDEEYIESKVAIESLEFAEYVVGGLSAAAADPSGTEVRSSSEVTLPLSDTAGGSAVAKQRIVLFGPGDITGVDAGQVVRRYPAPGTQTAEETVLAHVEFDRPELPWAFSAAKPRSGMRPWLTLIVIEKPIARWLPSTGPLPLLEIPADELPLVAQTHLWAHAQAAQSGTVSIDTRLSPEYARVNLSRLVSPRVLREDTDYLAAVVPTTDVGAKAGRGLTGGSLQPAWPVAGSETVVLPVYDFWEFRTGPDGDFQTIALRLQGVVAPYEVGRRFIDASEPGRPMTSLADGAPGGKQVLRCALFSTTPPPPERAEAETAAWPAEKTDELRTELDRAAQLEGSEEPVAGVPVLPVLGPRIYAKLHRGAAVVTGDDWFAELNLSPMNRIVAGLGTRVVQRDQEQLMQSAWAQLGDVEKANRAIALAQLAELLASRVHSRLSQLLPSRLLQVAGPLAKRVTATPGKTLAAEVIASATPSTVLTGAFRRSIRPGGPMLRRADAETRDRVGALTGAGGMLRDFTRAYENPDGVGKLSAQAIDQLDVALAAPVLGIDAARVGDVLRRAADTVNGGLVAHLVDPASWSAPQAGVDFGSIVVERWGQAALRETTIPALKEIREQRVAPLLAELATAKAAQGLEVAVVLQERAEELNNSLVERLGGLRDEGGAGGGIGRVDGIGGLRDDGVVFGGVEGIGGVRGIDGVGGIGGIRRGEGVGGIGVGGVGRLGAGGAIGRGASRVRTTPIGGAVARIPVGGLRVGPLVGANRLPTRIQGLSVLDVGSLVLVTERADAQTRVSALNSLAQLAARRVTPVLDAAQALPIERLRAAVPALIDPAGVLSIAMVPRRDSLDVTGLVSVLSPTPAIRSALRGRLRLSVDLVDRVFRPERLRRIMAAPVFRRPMYEALNAYDKEWLIPGLALLPDDDFVTILSTNDVFTEAFLVGLSDEMGRELLWRNYPTDQSGTYFRRFWDKDQDELAEQIHAFRPSALGSHIRIGGDGGGGPRAVIVVKSELIRRYPDVIIQAVKNHGTQAAPEFDGPEAVVARQLFAAHLPPDTALVGVDLAPADLETADNDWWILIAEHPTATRFGRPTQMGGDRFLLSPSTSSAEFAKTRLHDPVRVAFHAPDLLELG